MFDVIICFTYPLIFKSVIRQQSNDVIEKSRSMPIVIDDEDL